MAQNYEIDIKRFNGQDYDTLLPTPAAHASTHQADGSDPITLQTGNYGAASIPTSAYQNASVTRAKLSDDAKYSPLVAITDVNYSLGSWTAGATVVSDVTFDGSAINLWLGSTESAKFPAGVEIAICWLGGDTMTINFVDGVYAIVSGVGPLHNPKLQMSNKYEMIALKKLLSADSGDGWLVTGNVEVVS